MCQVFNNKYDSVSNEEVVRNAIATALDAAQVGVSIDMLSKYVNYEETSELLFAGRNAFIRKVVDALRHIATRLSSLRLHAVSV